ncbi:tRNA dimethylallyltransferase [Lachnellula hyalina]|uniref:tRNA dimethylallyltransferase n=1 Tax=Lachnellula hyalina TaxID=1316788 RepID=A0A8H8R580_9HELO|nr:tRNA dimethylallyltransferase [Lachnellula hyalina]TVY28668.1 tRNA dimethylallyltransferase [Lachnellula hyalina]
MLRQNLRFFNKHSTMAKKPPKDPLVVILGATGTGKSQLAVDLATRLNGEIINGDAMQMYDGLPIVTNRITHEEQKGVPHHLLGFVALDEEPWRVGIFKTKASQIIREIRSRGRLPILVGGTHYYTQSLLFADSLVSSQDGEEQAQPDREGQDALEKFPILAGTTEAMVERLREVDPVMAKRWHQNDRRKIQRSLEIFLTTGKRASEIYAEQKQRKVLNKECTLEDHGLPISPVASGSTLLFWVHSESQVLKQRLDSRIDKMLKAGLLDEVKSMNDFLDSQAEAGTNVDLTRGIWVSIGWKEFVPYLNALKSGTTSIEDLNKLYELSVEQMKAAHRQYAKRQVRWIRIKLASALSDEDALDKLYILDSSDVSQFDSAVSGSAIDATASFLKGDVLPPPPELSESNRQFLTPVGDSKDLDFRRECEICNVTAVIEEQWIRHLQSRRHRAQEKRQLRNAGSGRFHRKTEDVPVTEIT